MSGLPLTVSQPSNSRNWVVFVCKVRREPSLHVTRITRKTAHTYPGRTFNSAEARRKGYCNMRQHEARLKVSLERSLQRNHRSAWCPRPSIAAQILHIPHLRLAIRQWRAYRRFNPQERQESPNFFSGGRQVGQTTLKSPPTISTNAQPLHWVISAQNIRLRGQPTP